MKIKDLITWFDWANPAWQESWDNGGWQIEPGVLEQPARVLVCLTTEDLQKIIKKVAVLGGSGANFISLIHK